MKKRFLTLLAILPLSVFAQSGHFSLDASMTGAQKPAKVYLVYRSGDKRVVDSTVTENGKFHFQGELGNPAQAKLVLDRAGVGMSGMTDNADLLVFYLEPGKIGLTASDSVKRAAISGSPLNDQYAAYTKLLASPDKTMENLRAQYMAATPEQKNDKAFNDDIERKYQSASDEKESLQVQFIKQHPESFISLEALRDVAGAVIDLKKVEPLFDGLSQKLRSSNPGVEFAKYIAIAKATAVGAMAPVFTQNDVNNKSVSLTDFRGKYVLLDFWASWCGPCRGENPNVVKAFNKYKDKQFTVLGVSLDGARTKAAWLAAIKADGLEWTQVSDLKAWDNTAAKLYGIRAIPQNFLIDPSGKIIGKDLRGEDLDKKLKEIFGL